MDASASAIWRIRIELLGVVPKVWRRVDTSCAVSLARLHDIVQGAMGWDDAHLFSWHDGTGQTELAKEATFSAMCGLGESLVYVYDFGDYWRHRVLVEQEIEPVVGLIYPRCVGGRNACPPEDCGGTWGYADLKKTLSGPRNAKRRQLVEWLGSNFDPKAFDMTKANELIAEYM